MKCPAWLELRIAYRALKVQWRTHGPERTIGRFGTEVRRLKTLGYVEA